MDQKFAWSIINSRKPSTNTCITLKSDDKIIHTGKDVCSEFAIHFENISLKPTTPNMSDDMVQKLANIRTLNNDEEIRNVTIEELLKVLHNLPNKLKACGLDGISYEHLKYGGNILAKHLCSLFNLIFETSITPTSWKQSVIIPLYKGGNKPKRDVNSYRGISLIPSICKVFEKLVDNRIDELLDNFPNQQQMAYQKHLCSTFASFNLQETIHHYVERNSDVIVTFLDSQKAFDTVDHDGLKLKLFQYGIDGKLWSLLDELYSNLTSCVRYNNQVSRFFKLERGIRQGSSLSAKLYLVYINELIDLISNSNMSAVIVDINAGCPVQADDIALITCNEFLMQEMINICAKYSHKWKFNFSQSKSQVMTFSKRSLEPKLTLNNGTLPVCTSTKHVGITLNNRFDSLERTLSACRTIRSLCMTIIRQGVHPSVLNPITCGNIIIQLCYAKALYGCELWNNLSSKEVLLLERAHRYVCKYVQGLPKRTRTDFCTSILGWTSMERIIDRKKLLFFGRICNLPSKCLPRKILLTRLLLHLNSLETAKSSFVHDICRLLRKYDLMIYVDTFLRNSEFPSAV